MDSKFQVGDKVWNFPRAWGEILSFDEDEKFFHVRFKAVPNMTFFFSEEGKEVIQYWQFTYRVKDSEKFEISPCQYSTEKDFQELNSKMVFEQFEKVPNSKIIKYPEDSVIFSNEIEKEINLIKIFNYIKEALDYLNMKISILNSCKKNDDKEENLALIKAEISNLEKFSEIILGNEVIYDPKAIRKRQNPNSLFQNERIKL